MPEVFPGKRRRMLIMNFTNPCSNCENIFSFSHPVLPGLHFSHAAAILSLHAHLLGIYQAGSDKIWGSKRPLVGDQATCPLSSLGQPWTRSRSMSLYPSALVPEEAACFTNCKSAEKFECINTYFCFFSFVNP